MYVQRQLQDEGPITFNNKNNYLNTTDKTLKTNKKLMFLN